MKQLFIAVVFLSAAAAATVAQAPQGRTAASDPATKSSPVDTVSPISAIQKRPDAGKVPDQAAREIRLPESKDHGGDPPVSGITPEPTPTPSSESPYTADGEVDRSPTPGQRAPSGLPQIPDRVPEAGTHFRWRAAVQQSMLFLAVQHGYALTQPKTRRDLHGSFFKDYARSVRSLHGWGDGGKFFTNYVAHPMQGSLMGFVQVQNDPAGSRLRLGRSGDYWRSRAKALAWSAAWSTQFEVGPLSQASLGNVGLHGKQTYVDLVMTPTAGLGLLVAEDALDRYVIEKIERRSGNAYVRIIFRMALNPTRTAANLLRFKKPWHRDPGLR